MKGLKGNISTKVDLVCLHCNKLFNVRLYRKNIAKYCSRSCAAKHTYNLRLQQGFNMSGKQAWNKKYSDRKTQKLTNQKQAMKNNIVYRLSQMMSNYISERIKKHQPGISHKSTIGYTMEELKIHLEKQFLPGMTWENHSKYGWHIDHKKPISSFKYESINDKEFKECWSLSNLQPLWYIDNLRKSNKLL